MSMSQKLRETFIQINLINSANFWNFFIHRGTFHCQGFTNWNRREKNTKGFFESVEGEHSDIDQDTIISTVDITKLECYHWLVRSMFWFHDFLKKFIVLFCFDDCFFLSGMFKTDLNAKINVETWAIEKAFVMSNFRGLSLASYKSYEFCLTKLWQ